MILFCGLRAKSTAGTHGLSKAGSALVSGLDWVHVRQRRPKNLFFAGRMCACSPGGRQEKRRCLAKTHITICFALLRAVL